MTNISVDLRFTGLCGFARRPDGSEIRVVLGNARNLTLGHHHGTHAPHEALLLVANANLPKDPDTGLPDPSIPRTFGFDYFDFEVGKVIPVSAYRLNGVDLSFTTPASGFSYVPKTSPDCPSGDETAFDWIAQMRDVDAGRIDKRALVGNDKDLVLGRFSLKGGAIGTEAFRQVPDSGGGTRTLLWQFKDEDGNVKPTPRALAEKTRLTFDVDWVEGWGIYFSDFSGSSDTLFMQPNAEGRVSLWLLNMPILNVLGVFEGNPDDPEFHFIHHYSLSLLSGPPPTYIPYAVDTCGSGHGGLTGPKCPPAMYDSTNTDWEP